MVSTKMNTTKTANAKNVIITESNIIDAETGESILPILAEFFHECEVDVKVAMKLESGDE